MGPLITSLISSILPMLLERGIPAASKAIHKKFYSMMSFGNEDFRLSVPGETAEEKKA